MLFLWNDWNIGHVGEHGVRKHEAEHVVRHAAPPYPQDHPGEKYPVRGTTAAGRYLQVIYVRPLDEEIALTDLDPADRLDLMADDDVVYVIHARDLEDDEKRSFRRGRK